MKISFKQKIIIPTMVLIVLGMAGSTLISYQKSKTVMQTNIVGQIGGIAGSTVTTMDTWVSDRGQDLRTWKTFDDLKTALTDSFRGKAARKKASDMFADWKAGYDYYENICLADAAGLVVAASDPSVVGALNVADRDYFKAAVQGNEFHPAIFKSRTSGSYIFVLAEQVKPKGETPAGVLFAIIKISSFSSRYTDDVKVGEHGVAFLIDHKGNIIAHRDKSRIGTPLAFEGGQGGLENPQGTVQATLNGKKIIAAFKKSNSLGCTVMVEAQASEVFAPVARVARFSTILTLVMTVVAGVIIYFIARSASLPINRVVEGLQDAAEGEGDLTKRLEITSSDEIGLLGKWFNLFVERVQTIIRDVAGNSMELTTSSATLFEVAQEMSREAEDTSDKTRFVADSAERMSTSMASVAAAMDQATNNIQMVSATAEELTATIEEIAANSARGRNMAGDAVSETDATTKRVYELGSAASEIDAVVETITDISEQVNLLALNATIEAARAGEFGKGFAVVANEIKELARQTSEATLEIKSKVTGIQESTGATISQITNISGIVKDLSEVVTTIAAAVEEQSIATREIAQNVAQAAEGINDAALNVSQSSETATQINGEISDINASSGRISQSSSRVSVSAEELAGLAGSLDAMVKKFII